MYRCAAEVRTAVATDGGGETERNGSSYSGRRRRRRVRVTRAPFVISSDRTDMNYYHFSAAYDRAAVQWSRCGAPVGRNEISSSRPPTAPPPPLPPPRLTHVARPLPSLAPVAVTAKIPGVPAERGPRLFPRRDGAIILYKRGGPALAPAL